MKILKEIILSFLLFEFISAESWVNVQQEPIAKSYKQLIDCERNLCKTTYDVQKLNADEDKVSLIKLYFHYKLISFFHAFF
jgi:hypothetical protein